MTKIKKKKFIIIIITATVLLFICCAPFIINEYVKSSVEGNIIGEEEFDTIAVDCILVLGAGLKADGTPNNMLQERLDKGIELYKRGIAEKLLLSGDNGQVAYDEVNAMKTYVIDEGVPPEDIFLDHAGFSTYESVYRARDIFRVKKVIIVTQKYHLPRALYIAEGLGLDAYGVIPDSRVYSGQNYREIREILARNKDFFTTLMKPEPTYLGEEIPITSNGILSHD
ncbi:MAG: YdcF family protein [Peptostreptococcaceae bacterium]|nr:YdcF family protein [Peptostreptococcaceae bacterium]